MRTGSGSWLLGLLVVGLGVLFLLDTTGVAEDVASTWWPLLLILLGGVVLVQNRGYSLPGAVILLLGVGFLLENLEVLGEGWLGRYWPAILIVVGVVILLETTRLGRPGRWATGPGRAAGDWMGATAFMSGRKDQVTSTSWRGGRVTAVMGGVELDLRQAWLAPEGAVLYATAFMGGVEVRVPEDWDVVVRGTPFLGGFEDKTRPTPAGGANGRPRLVVRGTAMFGAVVIRN
jgi:hypothetical protein